MDQSIIQKIIARSSGRDEVDVGDKVWCNIDLAAMRDFGGPNVILDYKEAFGERPLAHPERVAITFDLHLPARDTKVATNHRMLREFAADTGVRLFDVETGVGQHTLLEEGLVRPFDVIVGTDSHMNLLGAVGSFATGVGTTDLVAAMATGKLWFRVPETERFVVEGAFQRRVGAKDLILHILGEVGTNGLLYKAVEMAGPTVEGLDLAGRITLMSMVTEMSGKIGFIEPNQAVMEFLSRAIGSDQPEWRADPDAPYSNERSFQVGDLPPMVAKPHSPDLLSPAADLKGTHIDQAFIGSCTNGRFEDLRAAADVLKGEHVAEGRRLIVTPSTRHVAKEALAAGLYETFMDAGAVVTNPSCALCTIGHPGVLAPGDVTMSTSNRNFPGKIGKGGEIYLCSPATAAASAIYGEITDPREV
jgi:homoaconitate hydratase family protein